MNKTLVFLGRFSPFHLGHQAIVEKMISHGSTTDCLIMIGSSNSRNERTPYTYYQRAEMVKEIYPQIRIIPLPDAKPELVYFDGSTNGQWLESIKKIEEELKTKFVFFGGSREDLEILSQKFETKIVTDRHKRKKVSATEVRTALMKGDDTKLPELLDHRIIPLAKKYFQEFTNQIIK